jgi:integrase
MSIHKAKDGRSKPWCHAWGYVDKDGKQKRATKWFGLEKEAKAHRDDIGLQIRNGTFTADGDTITIADAVRLWLEDCEVRVRSKQLGKRKMVLTTQKNYKHAADHILVSPIARVLLNDKRVAIKCQDFINEMGTRYTGQTERVRQVLTDVFKYARTRKLTNHNPLVEEPLEFHYAKKEMVILEMPELERLLIEAGTRHSTEQSGERALTVATRSAALRMMVFMGGMRKGEACGLQWPSVNWIEGTVEIWQQSTQYEYLVDRTKTPKSRRTVDMPWQVSEALSLLWDMRGKPTEGYVLASQNGHSIYGRFNEQYFAPAMRHAGLADERGKPKCRVHDLRHSYVSAVIEAKLRRGDPVDWKALAKEIGHSKASLTMDKYAHIYEKNNRIAIAAAAAADMILPSPMPLLLEKRAAPAILDATEDATEQG